MNYVPSFPSHGVLAFAISRFGTRPARNADRPASTPFRMAFAIKAGCSARATAVLISTSGRSPNVVNAAKLCHDRGFELLTFTGFEATNLLKFFLLRVRVQRG